MVRMFRVLSFRYLVFFYSGEVQYIPHGALFHLLVDNHEEVWKEATDEAMRTLIRIYFHFFPKRSIYQLSDVGKSVIVRDYNRWLVSCLKCNLASL